MTQVDTARKQTSVVRSRWGAALAAFAFTLGLAAAAPASAQVNGFVKLPNGQELYVKYLQAAQGRPTVVLLNGLTHDTRHWENVVRGLMGHGYGILSYDMRGQGQTLLKYAPVLAPIPFQQQLQDLDLLLRTLNIHDRVFLAGLSYGGGLAAAFLTQFPDRVQGILIMAPYTHPLDGQDQWIRSQIAIYRYMFPALSYDELYDYFLRVNVYSTYPAVEPVILENPFKLEATYRMAQGIRKLNVESIVNRFPPGEIHLMVAGNDQYIERPVLDRFWSLIPPAARMSRILVTDSEHKLVEAVPNYVAGWLTHILEGDPRLSGGVSFVGTAALGEAHAGNVSIPLPKF